MDYEIYTGWMEYFRRRPPGWRADNRAAIIAASFGGGKVKGEDLFHSLKVMKDEEKAAQEEADKEKNFAMKFFEMFDLSLGEGATDAQTQN